LGRNISKRKIGQNTDFSLSSESSLGRTKIFLGRMGPVGRRLDAPVQIHIIIVNNFKDILSIDFLFKYLEVKIFEAFFRTAGITNTGTDQ
jgi:hypothetical protein